MRDELAKALIDRCAQAYPSGFTPEHDLISVQTVGTYAVPANQFKYVHMYFAKSVTLWRRVRALLGEADVPALWSIGAGPMLDVFGWFWDTPQSIEKVSAVDVLDWSAVRSSNEWAALAECLVPRHDYTHGVVIPEPTLAPQCQALDVTGMLPSKLVSDGGTVIFPFMLNHLLGVHSPMGPAGRQALVSWINEIRSRDGRIIIADMPAGKTPDFWNTVASLFEVGAQPEVLDFHQEVRELRDLYANDGQGGRRCSRFMADATVLVLDTSGARFLNDT